MSRTSQDVTMWGPLLGNISGDTKVAIVGKSICFETNKGGNDVTIID